MKRRSFFYTILCLVAAWAARGAEPSMLPDSKLTPGVQNPAVTQSNIRETICNPAWVKAQRPPTSYTNKLKAQQMKSLGLKGDPKQWEEDHFWPIEDGGNPRDPRNLWPQWWPTARKKDIIENQIHRKLCEDPPQLKLSEALDAIKNWPELYRRKTGKLP